MGAVFGDEDDVDVADVVQLAGATFAHRDDGQRRRGVRAAHRAVHHAQRRTQRGVGEVGQVATDLGERQHRLVLHGRSQIQCGEHHHPAAVEHPKRGHRRDRVVVLVGLGGEDLVQLRRCRQRDGAGQQMPDLGVGDQVITERQGRPEDREQSSTQPAVLQQCAVEFVPARVERVGQAGDRAQRGVGVGGPGQRPQQFHMGVGVPPEPVEVGLRGRLHQSEPTDAGQLGSLRRGFGHP